MSEKAENIAPEVDFYIDTVGLAEMVQIPLIFLLQLLLLLQQEE